MSISETSLISSIDHLNLTVTNLKESVRWYKELFDFSVVESGNRAQGPWCILRSKNSMLCIYQDTTRSAPREFLFDDQKEHTVYHWGFSVTSPELFESRAKTLGLKFLYEGRDENKHSINWYIKDPTGYVIEVTFWREGICFDAL